jgi:hypothetical protein
MTADLNDTLDKAAQRLLAEAGLDQSEAGPDAPQSTADLAEKVKAFQAVMAWADKRRELLGPAEPPKKSKFEALKDKMHEDKK